MEPSDFTPHMIAELKRAAPLDKESSSMFAEKWGVSVHAIRAFAVNSPEIGYGKSNSSALKAESGVVPTQTSMSGHEVIDYRILSAKGQSQLAEEVRKWIAMGYQPFGGVSAAAFGISPVGGNQYIQAIVKYSGLAGDSN